MPENGRYAVSLLVRDMSRNPQADASNGIRFHAVAAGTYLGDGTVSLENGPEIAFVQYETAPLTAGDAIDVVFGNNGNYVWDGAGGQLRILKLTDDAPIGVFYAADAFRRNVQHANPYTGPSGEIWSVGKSSSPRVEDFTPFTAASPLSPLWGLCDENSTFYANLPVLRFNPAHAPIVGSSGGAIQPGEVFFPDEFFVHPNQGMCGVLRFTAPQDGSYGVQATARDIHPARALSTDGGIVLTVVAGGNPVGSAVASSDGTSGARSTAHVAADHIYLRGGETIDLCVGVNGGRQTNCDATAVTETITLDPLEDVQIFALDLRPHIEEGMEDGYEARGCIGWSDQYWTRVRFDAATSSATVTNLKPTRRLQSDIGFTIERESPFSAAAEGLSTYTLFRTGVQSEPNAAPYVFTLSGLPPSTDVRLQFYVVGSPSVSVDRTTIRSTLNWSNSDVPDVLVFTATTDAAGTLSGTFGGAGTLCAIQFALTGVRTYSTHTFIVVR